MPRTDDYLAVDNDWGRHQHVYALGFPHDVTRPRVERHQFVSEIDNEDAISDEC